MDQSCHQRIFHLQKQFPQFLLSTKNTEVCTFEKTKKRPIFLREHIERLYKPAQKVRLLIGSDLLVRMQSEQTFLQSDLEILQEKAEIWVVARHKTDVAEQVNQLNQKRKITLQWQSLNWGQTTPKTQLLQFLSSTAIRQLAIDGASLEGCLPPFTAKQVAMSAALWQESETQKKQQSFSELSQQILQKNLSNQNIIRILRKKRQTDISSC